MIIVDVDSHQEPGKDWLDGVPRLKERLSGMFPESDPRAYVEPPSLRDSIEGAAAGLADMVQRGLPPERRVPLYDVASPHYKRAYASEPFGAFEYDGADQLQPINPAKRLPWMDQQGIAVQNLINVKGLHLQHRVESADLGMEAIRHLNTYQSDHLDGYTNRLNLVTSLRFEDIDWCVDELTRMRARGSRAFMVPGVPVNLTPLYDPSYDRLWAAACDLGMIGVLHVGGAPAHWHPGWGNTTDPVMIRYLASTLSHINAHIVINAMVFGGVFERFPNFTLQISEFGISWLPYTVKNMDGRASKAGERLHGEYHLSLKPSEFVRRNVRVSGLPGQDPKDTFEDVPETVVFCSDYPHMEGTGEPVKLYSEYLDGCDETTKTWYFGEGILESYRRMGDPLIAA